MSSVSSTHSQKAQGSRQENQDQKKKSFLGGIKKIFTKKKNPPNAAQQDTAQIDKNELASDIINPNYNSEDPYELRKNLVKFLQIPKDSKKEVINIMFKNCKSAEWDASLISKEKGNVLRALLVELIRIKDNAYYPELKDTKNIRPSDKKATEEILDILNEKITSGEVTPTEKDKERIAKLKEWIGKC